MKYCSDCAAPLVVRVPSCDHLPRHICSSCERIFYENPKMVVGTVPVWEDKILLCKRNIEPQKGLWTLPAGYLEINERVEEGARRETLEETGALLGPMIPYRLFDIPHIGQMYFMFLAQLQTPDFHSTQESEEVALINEDHIPWDAIAFPVIKTTLHHFLSDRSKGTFPFKIDLISERMRKGK